ncbi:MAG TPA: tyrosine-type recombinase/integrase [Pyrinomonadaceae bacterium]|nr:tyrosine-type recombinase/integrase [Pyrinomonadaceae bacterium]
MIRKRGRKGFCSAEFMIDSHLYRFTFNGKNGMPLITSKTKARAYENDLRRQVVSGLLLKESDLKNFAKFFNEIYMDYSRKHKVPLSTQFDSYYGRSLVAEFGDRTLTQISPRMIEDYLVRLLATKTQYDTPYSPVTVRRHFNMLNQVFNMAIRERITNDNPCRLVSRTVLKKLPTWQSRDRWLNKYEPDEEERLFGAFTDYSDHLPAFCRIVLNTGIRPPKEVLSIKWDHVNLSTEPRYCQIDHTDVLMPPYSVVVAKGKDGRARVLPLNAVSYRAFSQLVSHCSCGDWLFRNVRDEPLHSVKRGFSGACSRANIANLRPYDLRHTFATRLLERGVHHYVISALMGHAVSASFGSRMTPGYAHVSWDAMVSAVQSLEQPAPSIQNVFNLDSGKIPSKSILAQKVG